MVNNLVSSSAAQMDPSFKEIVRPILQDIPWTLFVLDTKDERLATRQTVDKQTHIAKFVAHRVRSKHNLITAEVQT
jgi:hypothetical protein